MYKELMAKKGRIVILQCFNQIQTDSQCAFEKDFLLLTFFENLNFENNDILFYLFVALNPH